MRRCLQILGFFVLGAVTLVVVSLPGSAEGGEALPTSVVTVTFEIGDRVELETITRLVSIEDVRGRRVRASATPAQLEVLRSAGYSWTVVSSAVKAHDLTMCPAGWVADSQRTWDCYPSYGQYTAIMHQFVTENPNLCRLVDLGPGNNAVTPHRLWALVISDNPDLDEDEPEISLTSSIHGDETTGFILTLRLIDYLLTNHGSNTEITALVNDSEIWINPLANPDGTYDGGDHTVAGAIRSYTTTSGGDSGVDGNRNFPDPTGNEHPDGRAWWPETEAMMNLAATKAFVLSANFHGGVEVVNYPWDTWSRRHPDDAWFESLSRSWADLAQADSPGGYMTDFNNGITNGYDWFQVYGGRQDYMTYFHGSREVTLEVSATKLLPTDELDDHWQWNRRALLDFLTHAHEGIRGVVTDAEGNPLAATNEVIGIDRPADGSTVRTDAVVGDYHRLLLPGLYDLKISAPGHSELLVEGVAVIDGQATTIDATLQRPLVRRSGRRVRPGNS